MYFAQSMSDEFQVPTYAIVLRLALFSEVRNFKGQGQRINFWPCLSRVIDFDRWLETIIVNQIELICETVFSWRVWWRMQRNAYFIRVDNSLASHIFDYTNCFFNFKLGVLESIRNVRWDLFSLVFEIHLSVHPSVSVVPNVRLHREAIREWERIFCISSNENFNFLSRMSWFIHYVLWKLV